MKLHDSLKIVFDDITTNSPYLRLILKDILLCLYHLGLLL
jgi:hypothetical protein